MTKSQRRTSSAVVKKTQSPLEVYLREINEAEILSALGEKALAERIAEGDAAARDQLVRANLRLVVNIARAYTGKGLTLSDLIEEGNLGLLRAVEGFDPGMNTRFSTYAGYWIKQSIKRALVGKAKTVRIPAYLVDLLSKWRRAEGRMTEELGRTPTPEEIAEKLDIPKKKLRIVKKAIQLYNIPTRMESGWGLDPEDSDGSRSGERPIPDQFAHQKGDQLSLLKRALGRMGQQEADVLRMRFGLEDDVPQTLREIGDSLGLTRGEVRRIENEALGKMGAALSGESTDEPERTEGSNVGKSTKSTDQDAPDDTALLPNEAHSIADAHGYQVWFGTNRELVSNRNLGVRFSSERGNKVHYGWCRVIVPRTHRFGSLGTRWWKRWLRLEFVDDTVTLDHVNILDERDYWSAIRATLNECETDERQALVYLHGYNNSFEEAACRAAQIGFDLKAPGLTAFFSWPSTGEADDYPVDAAAIEASESAITDFLIRFATDSDAEKVHLIAHSMGNRGLLRAIQRIQADAQRRSGVRFGQIILAAPDVDADLFRDLAIAYPSMSERTTLYVSPKDRAVGLSEWLHGAPRAGVSPPITVVDGIDTVEVPGFDLFSLGHSYFAEAEAVLHDMFDLMRFQAGPDKRIRLKERKNDDGQRYWELGR